MVTEGGGMSWMSPNMKMETTSNGGIGKIFGRAFSGEKMFQNVYTAQGGEGMIAFASCFPGSIKAFEIAPGQEMILQKVLILPVRMELSYLHSLIKDRSWIIWRRRFYYAESIWPWYHVCRI